MAKEPVQSNRDLALAAASQWAKMGYVEQERDIRRALAKGEEVPEHLLHATRTRPQANVDNPAAYEAPPRSGKGSGVEAWREFAGLVTDTDADVLASMDRNDIIELLENRDIIEKEES